jgi:aminomethyltransferase
MANRKSHLYDYHRRNSKLTEFAGYDMPLWYSGIVEEHTAVRTAAGLFDVSHMGRFEIKGSDSTRFLDHVLPSDVSRVKPGRSFYTTICREDGGIIEDTITNKLAETQYVMIVNASNKEKDFKWLERHRENSSLELSDQSDDSALIAFQGPLAQTILQKVIDVDLGSLRRLALSRCKVSGYDCIVSRTGYTGEDGFEIDVLDCPLDVPEKAVNIWNTLLSLGMEKGVIPCGLGARDTLRLEAGMCLYGNDIDETTTPVEASLDFVVSQTKQDQYIGRTVLERQLKEGTSKKRVAFSMVSGGVPRHGFEIKLANQKVGNVTSGTFSPTAKKGIGMGYVPTQLSSNGTSLTIQIRNSEQEAEVVPVPFYDTTKYGFKRKLDGA